LENRDVEKLDLEKMKTVAIDWYCLELNLFSPERHSLPTGWGAEGFVWQDRCCVSAVVYADAKDIKEFSWYPSDSNAEIYFCYEGIEYIKWSKDR
jgi:hypothetical protein